MWFVFLPTHPSLPSPFLVQLSSKLLLCDVWEWWVWFFPWRFWFLSFWCFVDFFANNFWISPYNCWSKYEHSFGRLRDNFHIQTSPSVSQMEFYSIWVVAMAWNLWRSKTCAWYEYLFASSAPPDYLADDIHVCKLCFPSLQMIHVGCWSTSRNHGMYNRVFCWCVFCQATYVTQKTPKATLASSLLYTLTGGNTARALRYRMCPLSSECHVKANWSEGRRTRHEVLHEGSLLFLFWVIHYGCFCCGFWGSLFWHISFHDILLEVFGDCSRTHEWENARGCRMTP